jgi:hypothetical protein
MATVMTPPRVNGQVRALARLSEEWRSLALAASSDLRSRRESDDAIRAWDPANPNDRDARAMWLMSRELDERVQRVRGTTVGEFAEQIGTLLAAWRRTALEITGGRLEAEPRAHAEAAAYQQGADEVRALLDDILTMA